MNLVRAVLAGAVVWLCVLVTFAVLDMIPAVKGSPIILAAIAIILIIPFAAFGGSIYYKKGNANGLLVGLIMALTALVLDALVTVPIIEIPNGNTYEAFFTHPLLWLLVAVNITTAYMYWRLKINKRKTKN
ncbi:DUF5367 family protein [Catalinimonas niigatensis]|uniref:DUF5367 family protein n=1 Tax=Catalinimonas niigatensis TaxID=1397264 RepID=UPI0026665CF0|nr:DUF5367 family protein [Catalinimonas niigatensis]WPP48798.1 DUF5367 family protein [Catalinimonas niigatensis]